MDIGMTIVTADTDLPETPLVCLLVTGYAGRCSMSTVQDEFAPVMLIHSKGKQAEAFRIMTCRAIFYTAIFRELPLMIIGMTICTTVMFYGRCKICLMAG